MGSYPQGESLPSEDELALRFGVSRVTIRKAMERLEREGRVLRQRGRGTFPQPQTELPGNAGNLLLNNYVSLARRTQIDVLDYGIARLPAHLAELFDDQTSPNVLRIERMRRDKHSPISHATSYLSADLASHLPRNAVDTLPISAILASVGITMSRFQERITARLADSTIAKHLDIDVGTPLIAMTRQIRGQDDKVIELLQVYYRPDRYEYHVEYTSGDLKHRAESRRNTSDAGFMQY